MATKSPNWINWKKLFKVTGDMKPSAVNSRKSQFERFVKGYLVLLKQVRPEFKNVSVDKFNWQKNQSNASFLDLLVTIKTKTGARGQLKTAGSATKDPPIPPKP